MKQSNASLIGAASHSTMTHHIQAIASPCTRTENSLTLNNEEKNILKNNFKNFCFKGLDKKAYAYTENKETKCSDLSSI
jgi:hypothetical protein